MSNPVRTLSPAEEMKVFVGVIVQPLVAAWLAFIAFPIFLLDRNGHTLAGGVPSDRMGAAFSVAIVVGVVALLVTVVGALPAALWLMKRRRISLQEALLAGLGFGNLPFALGGLTAGIYGIAGLIRGLAFSSVLGAVCGGVFWCVALRETVGDDRSVR
jgi:hypothetical protein